MVKELSITIDVGTTNSKVSLFEIASGKLVFRENFQTPKKVDDYGELFDLSEIWDRLLEILIKIVAGNPGNIDSINISSVGEAGVLVDSNGRVVTPLIAWYDKRAVEYVAKLSHGQKQIIYEITGLPAHSNYSVPKIKWLVDHLKLSGQKYIWLNIPDLFSYFLTKQMSTEYSMASRTMCFDLKQCRWSTEILEMFDLQNLIEFPPVIASGEVVGYTTTGEIDELKKEKISVRIAGHDHMVGALGINLKDKDLLNSTGTTEGLLLIDDHPFLEEKSFQESLSNGIFTKPQYYTLFSSMPTGGNAFEWYQHFFNIDQKVFEQDCQNLYQRYLLDQIFLDDPVILIPHLNGSGAPFKNGKSRGLMYGISLETRREDVLLGIILGLCLEMKYVATCFPMEEVNRVIAIGPVVKNPLWIQLKADALNKDISVVKMEEAVSFGALKAAYSDFDYDIEYQVIQPDSNQVQAFNRLLDKYSYLYESKQFLVDDNFHQSSFESRDITNRCIETKEIFFS
ncbi:FGGY family carbohydrate kinase [Enterococcus hulanensis]|uniref:FGGY family carbohydrate kinase n=1 Tax=Enterococcus hulanensis TaxID=2559929 RepID=A0ABU3F2I4_9ENTE|nr:FGGY family carbohydrate kinase [Enterococcus hulanensis]MDT2601320.1 FGGY family carbohydrate kinase [Enterococcus hulanensis]MDT2610770.1 FGGY family carbohydrate kinase [Enterococcus hulanensis]MDT2618175.1 FGGY family carbohydrate kinase [Enterococcus hulanensis]MDT2629255.1 FGGY family carbohydrate kinase [Enterococcus hulanensis]MDT2656740.1 FGGY family carbohydrate kinase [Enterococcus hulanensis]